MKGSLMEKMTPEFEALLTTIVYLDCKIDALLRILDERDISIAREDLDGLIRKIHSTNGEFKRHAVIERLKNPRFDLTT